MNEFVLLTIHIWAWGATAVLCSLAMKNIKEGKRPSDGISLYGSLKWPVDVVDVIILVAKKITEK